MLYRQFATSEEIDNQYAMSRVIGDTAPYFQRHAEASAAARDDLDCELNIQFGPTLDENLDIFPAADPDAPIVIFIHGGYWRAFSSQDFGFVARGLVARGITVVIPNYALCPKVTLPEITRQCRAAAAWISTAVWTVSELQPSSSIGSSAGAAVSGSAARAGAFSFPPVAL